MIEEGYPKAMVHPQYEPAVISVGAANSGQHGKPARNPPVTVYKLDDELSHRAKGYVVMGEPMPKRIEYQEYPMQLIHPEYEEPIPDETHARRDEATAAIIYTKIPGRPGKFMPVVVKNEEERAEWEKKGYRPPQIPDPKAFLKAKADPKAEQEPFLPNEYPKWVKGKLAQNRDEENVLLGIAKENAEMSRAEAELVGEDDPDEEIARLKKEIAELKANKEKRNKKRAAQSEKMKKIWANRKAKEGSVVEPVHGNSE